MGTGALNSLLKRAKALRACALSSAADATSVVVVVVVVVVVLAVIRGGT
jgi:hypothetical protein